MILDSSALLALVFREPGFERVLAASAKAEWLATGAPTLAATSMVLAAKLGRHARPALALLIEELEVEIVPFEAVHARAAREAFRRFGKGRHPAGLTFSDCLTYAVAKVTARPLLFVGTDFGQTDLEPALPLA